MTQYVCEVCENPEESCQCELDEFLKNAKARIKQLRGEVLFLENRCHAANRRADEAEAKIRTLVRVTVTPEPWRDPPSFTAGICVDARTFAQQPAAMGKILSEELYKELQSQLKHF